MARYIKSIKINKLYHLHDFTIPVGDDENQNLLITGKNGSGKTILLNAMADALEILKNDEELMFTGYEDSLRRNTERLQTQTDMQQRAILTKRIKGLEDKQEKLYGKVKMEFDDIADIVGKYSSENFIIAFYPADRKAVFDEPKSIEKPNITKKTRIKTTNTNQLLRFLSHNKIQELLAKGQNKEEKVLPISNWFNEFEKMLKRIFEDENLLLSFNQEDYSFTILTGDKKFGFNQLSDGYAAVLDIVADLILRMQTKDGIIAKYDMGGIVLIDEVETHLHLELQKIVMPLLTTLFPNIQFIVSTHSPFVLSSLKNATAYDLENRQPLFGLTDYPFDSLAEGYFGVANESGYIQDKLNLMDDLLKKDTLRDSQKNDLKCMIEDFKRIPVALAPAVVGQYQTILNNNAEKIKMWGL